MAKKRNAGVLVIGTGSAGATAAWLAQAIRIPSFRQSLPRFRKARTHTMGMFTKISDEDQGSIDARGRISKPMTARDRANMQKGDNFCRKILIKAGCEPDSISIGTGVGGHPGGIAAVGKVVDENFETRGIKNLYVCDTSVFPRSPGVPPVLTLLAMVKRWVRQLEA